MFMCFTASVLSASQLCKVSLRVAFQCSQSGHTNTDLSRIFSELSSDTAKFHFPSPSKPFFPLKSCWVSCTGCILQAGPVTCTRPPEFPEHCPFCVLNQEVMGITVILLWYTSPFPLPYFLPNPRVFLQQNFFSLRRKALLLLFPKEELQRRISLRQKTFLKCFCRLRSLASSYKYRGERGSNLCVASLQMWKDYS